MNVLVKQSMTETKLWLRRRETVFFVHGVSLLLPVMFLAFFGAVYGSNKLHGISYISYLSSGIRGIRHHGGLTGHGLRQSRQ